MTPYLLSLISTYKYLIIFPFAVIEGTTAALVAGFFVSLGSLNFVLTYITLLLGDLIPDAILYYIGRYGNKNNFIKKYGSKIGISSETEESLNNIWFKHIKKAFIIGKLAYGVAVPFLISGGLVRYPFVKYFGLCTLISGIKVLIILLVGYYLGGSYKLVGQYIDYFYVIVGVVFAIVIASYFYFSRKMRTRFKELEK